MTVPVLATYEETELIEARPRTPIAIARIPEAFLIRARIAGIDALGQPVRRVEAKGGEPCRDVLRRARTGEKLILASFSPFRVEGPYREFGPVFILAAPSDEEVDRSSLPRAGTESDYLRAQFVVRAYSEREEILDAVLTTPGDVASVVDRFLDRDEIGFLHVRFPTYGCFALRIDRACFGPASES